MPRPAADSKPAARRLERAERRRAIFRFVLWAFILCFALSGVIWGAEQFEQFLIRDPRFILPPPADYGRESPNLAVEGVAFANRAQIVRVFANDLGRSVYLLPLAERRRALLRVSWVKDATIVRLWPNRVLVRISERTPAAFVGLETECITRWSLIDSDGVILEPPRAPHRFDLPMLRGVSAGEKTAMRGVRVRRMQSLLTELGPLAANISEIDVSDLDDLKIIEKMQDQGIKLMLGDRNFRDRLQHFLDHYPDIHKRLPDARVLDLRLDDRITVVRDAIVEEARRACS